MFISIPSNFCSLYSELNYSFSSSDSGDIILSIYNTQSSELCGIKSAYDTSELTINVAPILRDYSLPSPLKEQMGFVDTSNSGYIRIMVEEQQGEQSDSRTFLLSRNDSQCPQILSTMPSERGISSQESDLITLRCEEGSTLTARVKYYKFGEPTCQLELNYELEQVDCGVAIFNFVMESEQLDGVELEYVTVTFEEQYLDDSEQAVTQEIGELKYIVIDPPTTPIRLAWISSAGSIEHYTFPTIDRMMRGSDAMLQITLSSALESSHVRRMLSEILSSQLVWLDRGDCYEQIAIASESIEIAKVRELERITIVIECSDN